LGQADVCRFVSVEGRVVGFGLASGFSVDYVVKGGE
jgi:hypothetical protein